MKRSNITIDDISSIVARVEPEPIDPDDEFAQELAKIDPDAETKELNEYNYATFEISLNRRDSAALVESANDFVDVLYKLRAELATFETAPSPECVSNIGYLAENLSRARQKIAKLYNRAGTFTPGQLARITALIVIGIDKLNRNEANNGTNA